MAASNKICLLAAPRTGSTLLRQLLDSQQGVMFAGEVFHPRTVNLPEKLRAVLPEAACSLAARDADPVAFLQLLASLCPAPTFGLKLFRAHASAVREHVIAEPDWRIVILHRANFLAVYASRLAARATGAFAAGKLPGGKPKVPFDRAAFLREWRGHEAYYNRLIAKCGAAGKPFQLIEYREVRRPELVRNLTRQLGFPHETPFKTALTKEGSNDILSRFSNPDEAAAGIAAIGRSDWAREQGPIFLSEGADGAMAEAAGESRVSPQGSGMTQSGGIAAQADDGSA